MIRGISVEPVPSLGLSKPLSSKATIALSAQTTIVAQTSKPESSPPTLPASTLYVVPGVLLVLWAIAAYFFMGSKIAANKRLSTLQSKQVPCRNCQFFINNPYLKCAVHPSIAMTKQAVDCSDFNHNEMSNHQ